MIRLGIVRNKVIIRLSKANCILYNKSQKPYEKRKSEKQQLLCYRAVHSCPVPDGASNVISLLSLSPGLMHQCSSSEEGLSIAS